jgi:hypothetical protein
MTNRITPLILSLALAALPVTARAQALTPVPNHAMAEHRDTHAHLAALVKQGGDVGEAAQKVLDVLLPHDAREEQFVLPLLGLVDDLADGKVTRDMAWAIPMGEKVIAERNRLYDEHTAIINAVIDLNKAGEAHHDANLVAFAQEIADDEINDGEFVYPVAILVGKLVKEEMPAQ